MNEFFCKSSYGEIPEKTIQMVSDRGMGGMGGKPGSATEPVRARSHNF